MTKRLLKYSDSSGRGRAQQLRDGRAGLARWKRGRREMGARGASGAGLSGRSRVGGEFSEC